jgi:hypothetical protein
MLLPFVGRLLHGHGQRPPTTEREGWLANRSSFAAGTAHRRAFGAMVGNLRCDHERRLVGRVGIEPNLSARIWAPSERRISLEESPRVLGASDGLPWVD